MKFRSALLGATILVAPVAAMAQPVAGLYIGAGLGLNYRQAQDIKNYNGATDTHSESIKADYGFVGLGSVGWGLGNGLRFELEGSWRNNKATKLSSSSGSTAAGGNIQSAAAFVNAAYDFNLGPVNPYVGVGVGYIDQSLRSVNVYSGANHNTFKGDKGELGAQAFVGLAVPTPVAGLSLTAEYRFMAGLGNDRYNGTLVNSGKTSHTSIKLDDQYNHSGLIGLRYAFGAAPIIPGTIITPPPANSYLVFFDWDKATLTSRARQIIAQAATASRSQQVTKIEADGYTDTSGTPRYNQGLSVRRAQAVAAELIRDGVPRQAITINGFGETNPLVPTGPGVREPQNRRVQIIINK